MDPSMAEFMLSESDWPAMPDLHRAFLVGALPAFRAFPTLCGVAAGGSLVSARLDQYSDLDLVVTETEQASPLGAPDRKQIASSLGPLLAAFSGEHVHEP